MDKQAAENQVTVYTKSSEETFKLGQILGEVLTAGDCVALFGTLGSGKTLLTQGIARGMNVPENVYVTSPTFTLINEYPGRVPIYHVDLYRISDEDELIELGLDDLLGGDGVVVIEWAEKLPARYLRSCNIRVELVIEDANNRTITVTTTKEAIMDAAKRFQDSVRENRNE